jgi:hypothetical protein
MVRALASSHEEARQAALVGLGIWVERDAANGDLLAGELARVIPDPETARRLERLVWGFSLADGRDPEISRELVAWLGDASVAVRSGAFFHIRRLTGSSATYRYHPDGSEFQRLAAIREWEKHVRDRGALVATTPADIPLVPETPADEPAASIPATPVPQ